MSSSLVIEPTASLEVKRDQSKVSVNSNKSSPDSKESVEVLTNITSTHNHRAVPAAVIVESIARKRKSSPLSEQPLAHDYQNGILETASANKLARVVANSGIGLVNQGLVTSLGAHPAAHLQNAATPALGGLLVARLPSQIAQPSSITQNGSTQLLQQAALSNHLIRGGASTIGPQILPAAQTNLLTVQQQQQQQQLQAAQQAATPLILANPTPAAVPGAVQQTEQQSLQVQAAAAAHTIINSAGKPTTMSIQQKDTTYTKIFVGGLPYHTTDDSLRDYFTIFGEIEEAVVITDRQSGKSRGYGFVTMTDKASAESACKDPNPVIDGRKANVNLAYIGAKPRVMQTTVGYRPLPQAYLPTNQYSGVPAVYAQYPQHAAAYVTHNGVLIPAHAAPQPTSPFIDYAGAAYVAQLSGAAYATDVAATAGSASFGSAQLHHQAAGLAATSMPAGATQLIAATPTQGGVTAGGYQAFAGYHPTAASVAAAYAAAAANNPLHQPPPLASTPTPVTYAHLTAQLQQQAAERY